MAGETIAPRQPDYKSFQQMEMRMLNPGNQINGGIVLWGY